MTGGPWYNKSICKKLDGKLSEGIIIDARADRYNILCSIAAYEKLYQPSSSDYGRSDGGCPLPITLTNKASESLGVTIHFIGCWLKALEHNFLENFHLHTHFMVELFKNPQLNFIINPDQKKNANCYYILSEMVGMWKN